MTKRLRSESEYEYRRRKPSHLGRHSTGSLSTNEGAVPVETQPLQGMKRTMTAKDTPSPGGNKQAELRDENTSLTFYIARIILGAWKPFRETPLRTRSVCIVLFILAQFTLSAILMALLAVLLNLLSLIYLVLAISTSYIALEIWRKTQSTSEERIPAEQTTKGLDRKHNSPGP